MVESASTMLFPVEETNQVIKMLSNYGTAPVNVILALGVDKGPKEGFKSVFFELYELLNTVLHSKIIQDNFAFFVLAS